MSTALKAEPTYQGRLKQPGQEATGDAKSFNPIKALQDQSICAGDGDCIYCSGPETD